MATPIPVKYRFIYSGGDLPAAFQEALRHHGVMEKKGKGNQPDIDKWLRELGIHSTMDDDKAWCGVVPAICLFRTKWKHTIIKDYLWARNWAKWGVEVNWKAGQHAGVGDICVFSRPGGGGHVGFFVAWSRDRKYVLVYGGNQGNKMSFTWIEAGRLIAIRTYPWEFGPPAGRREYFIDKDSSELVSSNEA